MTAIVETPTVTRHWGCTVLSHQHSLAGLVRPAASALHQGDGPWTQLPLTDLIADEAGLYELFRTGMGVLSDAGTGGGFSGRRPGGIDLSLQVWNAGYELPQSSTPGDFIGWLFLEATEPNHIDSGTVAVYDPRAGSAMTAMPGLPWGRQLTVRPRPGNLTIVPGWLTNAVQPVEEGQSITVVVATSAP
ncbi:hypothetical protein [Kitasatospora sp. NPDC094016]|uniref:hypothetical protein n=1 Tax=Kitasatospora sp. NPDC094016 TaxID=3154986 RepID=UPI003318F80B